MTHGAAARPGRPVTVEVRWARVSALDATLRARLLATLSDDERARHARLRAETDRDGYLVAHALLRVALARHARVAPHALRFANRHDGKPQLVEPRLTPPLTFSLTHARGVVACVVARDIEVGIDAEDLGRRVDTDRLLARVLSERERNELRGLPRSVRRGRFFDAWSLREAYAKATGRGMARTLGTVEFTRTRHGVAIGFLAGQADRPGAWSFRVRRVSPHAVLAIAAHAPRLRVTWRAVHLPSLT